MESPVRRHASSRPRSRLVHVRRGSAGCSRAAREREALFSPRPLLLRPVRHRLDRGLALASRTGPSGHGGTASFAPGTARRPDVGHAVGAVDGHARRARPRHADGIVQHATAGSAPRGSPIAFDEHLAVHASSAAAGTGASEPGQRPGTRRRPGREVGRACSRSCRSTSRTSALYSRHPVKRARRVARGSVRPRRGVGDAAGGSRSARSGVRARAGPGPHSAPASDRIAVHRLCARSGGPHRLRGDTKPQP